MLAISVELLHGTFRGDPDGTAATGRQIRGEWPPSPARVFAALVAADGTRQECRVTDGTELTWIERLDPPVIYADAQRWEQRLEPRYVVRHGGSTSKSAHQEYVGRSGALNRSGVRVSPRDPFVVYVWGAESPGHAILDALRLRAARVGYLGASDSPVRVSVTTRVLPDVVAKGAFIPDPRGDTVISVTRRGHLDVLDRMYDAWRERGAAVSRQQFPALAHGVPYRSPGRAEPIDKGTVVAWLRLGTAVSGRRISTVTALFKEAVLSRHQSIHGEPPPVLHGHGFNTKGYETARYLALPDVGFQWSRGRIHGLALWMPSGCAAVERQKARDAAFAIPRLSGRNVDVSVAPRDDEKYPVAADPARWEKQSRRWATAVPAIHERRRAVDLAEVVRWCRHAGLPEPVAFRSARTPLAAGALDLAPVEVNRPGRPALPYSHVELLFDRPVTGPVVIGSGRQRGFGLCIPVHD